MASGTAIDAASTLCIEQGKQIAAHVLEAAVGDIEFERGRFTIAGTDRGIGIMELAERLRERHGAARRTCRPRWTCRPRAEFARLGLPERLPRRRGRGRRGDRRGRGGALQRWSTTSGCSSTR